MKMLTKSVSALCAVYGIMLFSACEKEAIEQTNPMNLSVKEQNRNQQIEGESLIASLDLGAKGFINFSRLDDGELIVSGVVSTEGVLPNVNEQLPPADLYTLVSGKEAPKALIEAYEEVMSKYSTQGEVRKDQTAEGVIENTPLMSSGTFKDKYCPQNWDYLYCWTNRTGTSYVEAYKYSMHSHASPYRGSVRHRLRYKSFGSWKLVRDYVTEVGETTLFSCYGPLRRTRESKVFEASGDGYHHSIYGTN
ncbi:MAG: hypothetical protein KDD36_08040 [Flavobacteriales bacterium]|nr:hypothetical protein [Flavobacteriales bacterium]